MLCKSRFFFFLQSAKLLNSLAQQKLTFQLEYRLRITCICIVLSLYLPNNMKIYL